MVAGPPVFGVDANGNGHTALVEIEAEAHGPGGSLFTRRAEVWAAHARYLILSWNS